MPPAGCHEEKRHRPSSDPASRGRLLPQAGEGFARAVSRLTLVLVGALACAGCDPRDCALGIANGDCYPQGSALAAFPQDDAICRSYGLTPGTHDYKVCRKTKAHERALTERETDYGFLNNPLTPSVR